jgi:thiamine kinase-like enzyme
MRKHRCALLFAATAAAFSLSDTVALTWTVVRSVSTSTLLRRNSGWNIYVLEPFRGRCYSPSRLAAFEPQRGNIEDHDETVRALLDQAGIDANQATVEVLDGKAAFCNTVYRITIKESNDESSRTTAIAKVFSPLALARMDQNREVGELDDYCAQHGLAPRILARHRRGVLMEDCDGTVLSGNFDKDQARWCAQALAKLHSLEAPSLRKQVQQDTSSSSLRQVHLQRPPSRDKELNMLWSSCGVMMSNVASTWQCDAAGSYWDKERIGTVLQEHKESITASRCRSVPIGHGDCKPSNAIALAKGGVVFIDLELTGLHYRAFDVAKFLRTNKNESSRRQFLEWYTLASNERSIPTLEHEVELLTPLTWLEAAIFFAAMQSLDAEKASVWNRLASDRLENYSLSVG